MPHYSDMLIYLRKRARLTQQELADKTGLSRSAIGMYETGKREPDLETFELFADFYNVDMNTLTGRSSSPVLPAGLFPLPASRAFPLVGDIACGTPILAEQNITEYVNFPGDLNADFCLRCKGDSMVDARIYDGDIVFIRQQPEVENGEIAAVLIGEETTLKRVYRDRGVLTLMPANPAYPPMVYSDDQLEQVRILGKAVSFLSAVK